MFSKITAWFAVNALLPIIVPVLFLAIVSWFGDGTFPFVHLFIDLINSGFYIFSAATLIFSLYEEYRICEQCIKPGMQTILVLLMIASLFMFYKIQTATDSYVKGHQLQFYIVWGFTALFAGIVKYKILRYKKQLAL